jgi:hypothetical protein
MKKTIAFDVTTTQLHAERLKADTMTLSGNLVNFLRTEEETDLNPFPKSTLISTYSLYQLVSIYPVYEEVDDAEIATP